MRTDKDKAISLRKQGKTYKEISEQLGMSKSTLSIWFKGIDFLNPIREALIEKNKKESTDRIKKLNRARGDTLKIMYEIAVKEALTELEQFKNNPLFISAIALYWGEGDKLSKNHTRLTNTDAEMMKIFVQFLIRICNVPKEKIRLALFIYPNLKEAACKQYWSNTTGIDVFHKTQVLPSRHKTKRLPHGICTVIVSNTYLKKKVTTWIDHLPQIVLNVPH